jgi:hypothetical protein
METYNEIKDTLNDASFTMRQLQRLISKVKGSSSPTNKYCRLLLDLDDAIGNVESVKSELIGLQADLFACSDPSLEA